MRILLSISILAFVALLWATVSIVYHISSDRRRRSLRTRQPSAILPQTSEPLALISSAVSQLSITEVFSPAPILTTGLQRPALENKPIRQPSAPAFPAFSLPKLTLTPSASDIQLPSTALLSGLLAQPQALRPALVESPANMATLLRRPVQSVPAPSETASALPSRRTDWAYFNKDMGDLSDPAPSRIRDRSLNRAMPQARAR